MSLAIPGRIVLAGRRYHVRHVGRSRVPVSQEHIAATWHPDSAGPVIGLIQHTPSRLHHNGRTTCSLFDTRNYPLPSRVPLVFSQRRNTEIEHSGGPRGSEFVEDRINGIRILTPAVYVSQKGPVYGAMHVPVWPAVGKSKLTEPLITPMFMLNPPAK